MNFSDSDVHLTMTLRGTLEEILPKTLPHEITHAAMATHFLKALPRWADEGISVMSEDEDERAMHRRLGKKTLDERRAMPLRRLFALKDYPRDVNEFFAQGFSVVHFLVEKKDRKTLLQFIKEGMEEGIWDDAVEKHYGYEGVDALEEAWLASFKKPGESATKKNKEVGIADRITPPTSAAPLTAMAYYDAKQKRLLVYHSLTYSEPASISSTYSERIEGKRQWTEFRWSRYFLDSIEVYDSEGKKLDKECLTKLEKPTPVLISNDGKKVDPFFTQLLKPGTMILTNLFPEGSSPAQTRPTPVGDLILPDLVPVPTQRR